MVVEEEVVKQYSVYPAIEQTKLLIIERLKILFDAINILFQNKLMNRKDDEVIAMVKSTTISIYLMIKPKIIEYLQERKKVLKDIDKDPIAKSLLIATDEIEKAIKSPSEMKIEDAIYFADVLNIFCHEYGITKISFFSGTAKASGDISSI